MATRKVTLRTAFSDVFRVGDVEITKAGTEIDSRTKADEIIETARRSGVTLYEVTPVDEVPTTGTKKNEGSGS